MAVKRASGKENWFCGERLKEPGVLFSMEKVLWGVGMIAFLKHPEGKDLALCAATSESRTLME